MNSCLSFLLNRNGEIKENFMVNKQCCICDFNILVMRSYGISLKLLALMSIHKNIALNEQISHIEKIKHLLNLNIPEILKAQIIIEYVCCAKHNNQLNNKFKQVSFYRFKELYMHIEQLFIRPKRMSEPRYFSLTVLTYFYLKYLLIMKGPRFMINLAEQTMESFPTLHFVHKDKITLEINETAVPICFHENILFSSYKAYKLLSFTPSRVGKVYSNCKWQLL